MAICLVWTKSYSIFIFYHVSDSIEKLKFRAQKMGLAYDQEEAKKMIAYAKEKLSNH